jgi:hypothetical protein
MHHKIDTSATAYTKKSIDVVMEIANLVLPGHGLTSCRKSVQAVRKSKPIETNGDNEKKIPMLQSLSVID